MGSKHDFIDEWLDDLENITKEWKISKNEENIKEKDYDEYLDMYGVYHRVSKQQETSACIGMCSICPQGNTCTYYDPDHN